MTFHQDVYSMLYCYATACAIRAMTRWINAIADYAELLLTGYHVGTDFMPRQVGIIVHYLDEHLN